MLYSEMRGIFFTGYHIAVEVFLSSSDGKHDMTAPNISMECYWTQVMVDVQLVWLRKQYSTDYEFSFMRVLFHEGKTSIDVPYGYRKKVKRLED